MGRISSSGTMKRTSIPSISPWLVDGHLQVHVEFSLSPNFPPFIRTPVILN